MPNSIRILKSRTWKGWTIERIIREWTKPRPIPERVLSAWRTYTPENVIEQILAHRTEIYRRRLETPWIRVEGFAYPLPHLSEIERKPEVFATAIDTDGPIMVRTRHGRDRINRGYKYVYERPKIFFWSETLQLTMKFANIMLAPIRPVRPPKKTINSICNRNRTRPSSNGNLPIPTPPNKMEKKS